LNIGGSGAGNPSSYLGEANFSAGSRASSEAHDYDVPGLEAYHGTNTFLTEALTIEANKAIDQAVADGKPFFLHFAQFAPHTPLNPDVRFLSNYMNAGLPAAEVVYASLIEGLDKSLGDVLANIERHGLSESTFFVFMSDNGASVEGRNRQENEYNAPLRSHKRSAFEGALRVPLVIKWAGHIKPNTTNATPVITDDLFPTILSLARVPDAERYTAGIRGRDMSTMLTGQGNVDPERVLLWHFPHATVARIGQPGEPFSAIRQGQWKLIFHYGSRRYELYNLSTDLSETHDVVAENGAVVARLSRLLRDALSKEGAQLPVDAGTKRQVDLPPLVGG
jgi:arylsulfatase A-like enzyme